MEVRVTSVLLTDCNQDFGAEKKSTAFYFMRDIVIFFQLHWKLRGNTSTIFLFIHICSCFAITTMENNN